MSTKLQNERIRNEDTAPEVMSARLKNLHHWIGELVLENQRLRMAIREQTLKQLLNDQGTAFRHEGFTMSQHIKAMQRTTLS